LTLSGGLSAFYVPANVEAWDKRWKEIESNGTEYVWFKFGMSFRAFYWDGEYYALDASRPKISDKDESLLSFSNDVRNECFAWEDDDEWCDVLCELDVQRVRIEAEKHLLAEFREMKDMMGNFTEILPLITSSIKT